MPSPAVSWQGKSVLPTARQIILLRHHQTCCIWHHYILNPDTQLCLRIQPKPVD